MLYSSNVKTFFGKARCQQSWESICSSISFSICRTVFDFNRGLYSIHLDLGYSSPTGWVTDQFYVVHFSFPQHFTFLPISLYSTVFPWACLNATITYTCCLSNLAQVFFDCHSFASSPPVVPSPAEFCCCSLSKTPSSLCIAKTIALAQDLCSLLLNYCHLEQLLS